MTKTLKCEGILDRDQRAIKCPTCGGFSEEVECNPEEVRQQSCGRIHACCIRAFECCLCKARILAHLEAPEMEDL